MTPKRLFLIDGTALAYRAYHAFANTARRGLTTKDGRPTAAVYGFTTTLLALLDHEKPQAIAIAFDGPRADLARTKVYAGYKSTRAKMPDELVPQLPLIEQVVTAYGIPIVRSAEHEADDLIGTLAVRARDAGWTVFIVTADKDFMQLVGERIRLWSLRASTRTPEVIGPAEVEARFGVKPEQMVDLLALMGDSSDNVPGVPKVGPKTASELIARFGDLDTVLARAAEIDRPAIREALTTHREDALLSRRLVTLHTDVPLAITPDSLAPARPQRALLEPLFRDLEFTTLLKSLPPAETPAIATDYRVVHGAADRDTMLQALTNAQGFALEVETSTQDPLRGKLLGVACAIAPGQAFYVPCPTAAELALLRPCLEDASLRKTVADSKRVQRVLHHAGVTLRGVDFDPLLASYCLTPGIGEHSLEALSLRYLGHQLTVVKGSSGAGRKQKTFDQIAVDEVGRLKTEAADLSGRLRTCLAPELQSAQVEAVFRELEMPLVPVLAAMENAGIAIDIPYLQALGTELAGRLEVLEDQVLAAVGEPFNLGSPQQVAEILFERLELHKSAGIARPKRTPTGQIKTDADMLERLAAHHPVPRLLLDWRQLNKLKGTYVDSLPQLVNPETGRIHTTFNQAVAATGRLSSDNPNLQNIPIRTAEGQKVRKAFVARAPGWVLLSADYSQIELRILAHASAEPVLLAAFQRGDDIHTKTAALVHGLDPQQVSPALRNQAKVINYGLMYGMGASRLAGETGMTPPEAKRFIDTYFAALPRVKALLDGNLAKARATKEVRTLFGRRRPLPDIDSTNAMQRVAAENMAVNTPIQGTAADIIKRAMLEVHRRLEAEGLAARLLLQVHDELVLDVPETELPRVEALVRDAMTHAADLLVPLEVVAGHGWNWLDAH